MRPNNHFDDAHERRCIYRRIPVSSLTKKPTMLQQQHMRASRMSRAWSARTRRGSSWPERPPHSKPTPRHRRMGGRRLWLAADDREKLNRINDTIQQQTCIVLYHCLTYTTARTYSGPPFDGSRATSPERAWLTFSDWSQPCRHHLMSFQLHCRSHSHIRCRHYHTCQPVTLQGSVHMVLLDCTSLAITQESWCGPGRSGELQADIEPFNDLQSACYYIIKKELI